MVVSFGDMMTISSMASVSSPGMSAASTALMNSCRYDNIGSSCAETWFRIGAGRSLQPFTPGYRRKSIQLFPSFALLHVNGERHVQPHRVLHQIADGFTDREFCFRHFENQFVVNLKDHAGTQLLPAQFCRDADHGNLNDV